MHKLAKAATPFVTAVALLILGTATVAMAGECFIPPPVPEIDPASAGSALLLIGGAIMIIRGRRKK